MTLDQGPEGQDTPELQSSHRRARGSQTRNGVRLVVGASRGIGLALVRTQLEDPAVSRVIATYRPSSRLDELGKLLYRHEKRLQLVPLDVTSEPAMEEFGEYLAAQPGGVDLTIHAAGILHDDSFGPEKSLEACETVSLMRLFEVNSVGPLMVARALLSSLPRSRAFTFAAVSAMVGSISDNRLGGWYGYRASKAALNQFVKTLSNECRLRFPNAAVVAIHPGTTDTELSRPFQRSVDPGKLYTPEQTARRILRVLNDLDPTRSGQFLNWDGSRIPW